MPQGLVKKGYENALPSVCVVVVAYNAADHLPSCLDSVAGLDYPPGRIETIVVDNASQDGTRDLLARRYPQVRVLRQPRNLGFAEANNRAAGATSAECLALLNADMRVESSWLRELVALYDPADRCHAVSSAILDWAGERIDFAGGVINFHAHGNHVGFGLPVDRVRLDDGRELPFACGGAMLVGRETFLAAGGFDPAYFIYFEDVDFGWRLRLLGHRIRLAAHARAYHKAHGTTASFRREHVTRLYERNALRTLIKNVDEINLPRLLAAALFLVGDRARLPDSAGAESEHRPLGPESLARLDAISDVVRDLDQLLEHRRWIQQRRCVPDSDVFAVFGRPLQPAARDDPPYLAAFSHVAQAFGVRELMPQARSRVVAVCPTGSPAGDRTRALAASLEGVADVTVVSDPLPSASAAHVLAPPDVVLVSRADIEAQPQLGRLPALVLVDVAGTRPPAFADLPRGDAFVCADDGSREEWIRALAPPGSLPVDASALTSPLAAAVVVPPTPGDRRAGPPAGLAELVSEPWQRERLEARRRAAYALVPVPAAGDGGRRRLPVQVGRRALRAARWAIRPRAAG